LYDAIKSEAQLCQHSTQQANISYVNDKLTGYDSTAILHYQPTILLLIVKF